MTPAAVPFDSPLLCTEFRNVRKLSRMTTRRVKASETKVEISDNAMGSCQECGHCSENVYNSPPARALSGKPSTSSGYPGDTHIEISDDNEDSFSQQLDLSRKDETCVKEGRHQKGLHSREGHVESVFHDRYPFLGSSSRGNYYIIRRDGRLAEVFRTDLSDRLRKGIGDNEDSDDENVPGTGLSRMVDRWRAEWNNGIQIPLGTTKASSSLVRQAVVKCMPSPLSNSIREKRSGLIASFFANPFVSFSCEPLRLYESTALDERWVKLFNQHHDVKEGLPPLTMEVFLELMNDFEIECYKNIHRKLLEPLHSPSSRAEHADEEAACDICRAIDSEPDDEMVFCDGCNLCVHMSCYGLQALPSNEWLCMKCRLSFGRNPPCVLCPTVGGALKCTDNIGEWAHVVCALWIPECRFGDFEKREPIIRVEEIKEERWTAKCSICDTRQGACIKCIVDSCKEFFHVSCALRSGLEMRIEQDPVDERIHMISLCARHHATKLFAKQEELQDLRQGGAAGVEELCGTSRLTKLEQICYSFVDPKSIAERLRLSVELTTEVFSYWTKKRLLLSGGKALIENLQDDVKITEPDSPRLELPTYSVSNIDQSLSLGKIKRKRGRPRKNPLGHNNDLKLPSDSVSVTVAGDTEQGKPVPMWNKLRDSVKMGRTLVQLVLQRCEEQREFLNVHLRMLLMIAERFSKPFPLSKRSFTYLTEVMESCCWKKVIQEGCIRAEEMFSSEDSTAAQVLPQGIEMPSSCCKPLRSSIEVDNSPEQIDTVVSPLRRRPRRSRMSSSLVPRRLRNKAKHHTHSGRRKQDCSDEFVEQCRSRRLSLRSSGTQLTDIPNKNSSAVAPMVVPPANTFPNLSASPEHVSLSEVTVVNRASKYSAAGIALKQTSTKKNGGRSDRKRLNQKPFMDRHDSTYGKRGRCVPTLEVKLRLLKSLNLKRASKNFEHRWGEVPA